MRSVWITLVALLVPLGTMVKRPCRSTVFSRTKFAVTLPAGPTIVVPVALIAPVVATDSKSFVPGPVIVERPLTEPMNTAVLPSVTDTLPAPLLLTSP
jgi:hypothetical protein